MAEEFYGEAPQEEVFDPSGWEESPEYQGVEPQQEQYQEEPDYREEPQEEYFEETTPTPLLDEMASKNYDVSSYNNDEELLADIQSGWKQADDRQAELDRQMAWLQQQQQLQQPQQEYADEDYYEDYGPPDFDPSWTNLVDRDESGQFVIRPEYIGSVDPSIAEKVNDYVEWRQERSNSLIEHPLDTLMDEGLEDYIEARISSALNSTLETNQTSQNAEAFVAQHQEVLFITDPNTGAPMTDPNTGSQLLSPFGDALNNAHVMLLEQGMNDPEQRHNIAVQLAFSQVGDPYASAVGDEDLLFDEEVPQPENNEYYKGQYEQQPFAGGPTNPEYMPDTRDLIQESGMNGMPEHNSLGSLATQLAVHKGFLQPKG